jgi:exonuclease III
MTQPHVKLLSFNVNGLGQKSKRSIIFNKVKQLKCIAFLQETHCTKPEEKVWEDQWKGKIYFSNGTSKSAGVAILFPPDLDIELCDKKCDDDGRFLLLKIKIQFNMYVLCNVYAPTQDHKLEQNNFSVKIKEELAPYANDNILLGGDFNFYKNPKLDKMDSMINKNDNPVYRNEICALLEAFTLSDCFRNLYLTLRRYTWHARGKSSRLDYWFISEHLLNELESYQIIPGLHSDHSILKVEIGNDIPNRGKGIWKFNNSLLHDTNYVKEIKNIIHNCESEYSELEDKGLAWEMTKMKIRSFSVPYCVKKKKERQAFKKSLEHDLEQLQELLDSNPSQQSQELYNCSNKRIRKI